MVRGLYTAASGMLAQWSRVDVISNNIANSDTTGFKFDEVLLRAYPTQGIVRKNDATFPYDPVKFDLRPPVGVLGTGAQVEEVVPIFTPGPLEETGSELDTALDGEGLFVVQTPAGTRYTRDGTLSITDQGILVNRSGFPFLDERNQIIRLPQGQLQIGEDGQIYVNNNALARLQIVRFPDPLFLEKRGNNLFAATVRSGAPVLDRATKVKQGYREKPNMNVVEGMVEMIKAFRTYEANSRAIQAQDESLDRLINTAGATSS